MSSSLKNSYLQNECPNFWLISARPRYRYTPLDPLSTRPWPAMPEVFLSLADAAASVAGFSDFVPDACLINAYAPGAKMSLTRTRMSVLIPLPLFPFPWACPRSFNLAASRAAIRPNVFPCFMVM